MSDYDRMLNDFDRLDIENAGPLFDPPEVCPDCDGDGYIDLFDDDGFVIGPGPCPRCCHPHGEAS